MVPDRASTRALPWQKTMEITNVYLVQKDGNPSPFCGRNALKMALDQLKELGFEAKIGFELEFLILNKDLTPVEDNGYGLANTLLDTSRYFEDLYL